MNDDNLRDHWLSFQREHHCSIDRMLCAPKLRRAFLFSVGVSPNSPREEEAILWRLVSLRKRKDLPPQSG